MTYLFSFSFVLDKNVWLVYIKGRFLILLGDFRNSAACQLCNVQGHSYIFDMEVYLMHCVRVQLRYIRKLRSPGLKQVPVTQAPV